MVQITPLSGSESYVTLGRLFNFRLPHYKGSWGRRERRIATFEACCEDLRRTHVCETPGTWLPVLWGFNKCQSSSPLLSPHQPSSKWWCVLRAGYWATVSSRNVVNINVNFSKQNIKKQHLHGWFPVTIW